MEWLKQEMDRQKMSQADLVRGSGLSASQVSKILSLKSSPSADALVDIARALRKSPDEIMRAAGLLHDLPTPRDQFEEILAYRLSLLTDAQLEDVLKYVEFISTREQKPVKIKTT